MDNIEIWTFETGQKSFITRNVSLGLKLTSQYQKEIVKKDLGTTFLTESKKIAHKVMLKTFDQ